MDVNSGSSQVVLAEVLNEFPLSIRSWGIGGALGQEKLPKKGHSVCTCVELCLQEWLETERGLRRCQVLHKNRHCRPAVFL